MPDGGTEGIQPPPSRESRRKKEKGDEQEPDDRRERERQRTLDKMMDNYHDERGDAKGVENSGRVSERTQGLYEKDDLRHNPQDSPRRAFMRGEERTGKHGMNCRGCGHEYPWDDSRPCATPQCRNKICYKCKEQYNHCKKCWHKAQRHQHRHGHQHHDQGKRRHHHDQREEWRSPRRDSREREPLGLRQGGESRHGSREQRDIQRRSPSGSRRRSRSRCTNVSQSHEPEAWNEWSQEQSWSKGRERWKSS